MKFPYISLDGVVDEAFGQVKKIVRESGKTREDAYNEAIAAAKLIGGSTWEESSIAIPIKKHVGVLPKMFLTANKVWAGEVIECDIFTVRDVFWCDAKRIACIASRPLWSGDSSTVRLLTDKARGHDIPASVDTFTFKVPPGLIRTSFGEGWVALNYNHLKVDENGVIMVQDEENGLQCINHWIKLKLLEEAFYMGQVNATVYKSIDDNFHMYLSQAKGIQKFPDPLETEEHITRINNRYSDFNLRHGRGR